jgi:hypothetical protein
MNPCLTFWHGWNLNKKEAARGRSRGADKVEPALVATISMHLLLILFNP